MTTTITKPSRLIPAVLLWALTLLLGGCFTLSVNPLYENADLVSDPGLIGVWGDPEDLDNDTWQFTANQDGSLRLIIRPDNSLRIVPDRDGLFSAHLVGLDGAVFLDLYPEEPETGSEFYKSHIVPAHSFWLVERQGNVTTLSILDSNELEKGLDDGRIVIDHIKQDGVLVLTASVADLQALVTRHRTLLFNDGEIMQRLQ